MMKRNHETQRAPDRVPQGDLEVHATDQTGNTLLHHAAQGHSVADQERVLRLLEAGAEVDAVNLSGQTPLQRAVLQGAFQNVITLVEAGADLNHRRNDLAPPLECAVVAQNQDIVNFLLDRGADIDQQSFAGTALHAAVRHRDEAMVRLLISRGADPTLKDTFQQSALQAAQAAILFNGSSLSGELLGLLAPQKGIVYATLPKAARHAGP